MASFDFTLDDSDRVVTYRPWTDGYAVGFEATHDSGWVEYIYLNPSAAPDDGVPNVFLYSGAAGDPALDEPICHINMFDDRP